MQDSELRGYFTSIKQDANRVEERLDKQDQILEQIARTVALILDMLSAHETTMNYHGNMLGNHERRIGKLERQIS
ncbi:MAG: hypothetical protein WCV73_01900 [Patescibacteria group bacterium]|jgi:hypothetical protein